MNSNRNPNSSKTRRTVVTILIAVAAVVVVGVVLVMRCLTFDETGAHVVDRYGVLARESAQAQPQETGSGETPAAEPEQQPSDTEQQGQRMVMLAANAVTDSEVRDQLTALQKDGALQTVVLNIKDSEGNLNLACDTDELDTESLTDSDAEELADAIAQMKQAGIHVIGRIYCLHDQQAAESNADLAIPYMNGGAWLDYDSTRWLDPTNADAIAYLCDIARSAVQAGCDELMLADLTFPPRGHLDRAEFADQPDDQASALTDVLEEVQAAAGDVPVSLTADSLDDLTVLSENGAEDGIDTGDVGAFLSAAHRIFIPLGDEDADSVSARIDAVHELAPDADVVPVFDSFDAWSQYSGSAVLDAVSDSDILFEQGSDTEENTDGDGTEQADSENSDSDDSDDSGDSDSDNSDEYEDNSEDETDE